jgi:hypothetical protein
MFLTSGRERLLAGAAWADRQLDVTERRGADASRELVQSAGGSEIVPVFRGFLAPGKIPRKCPESLLHVSDTYDIVLVCGGQVVARDNDTRDTTMTTTHESLANPYYKDAVDLGASDALLGREPLWYRVGDSYVSAEDGHIGNSVLGAAYVDSYCGSIAGIRQQHDTP